MPVFCGQTSWWVGPQALCSGRWSYTFGGLPRRGLEPAPRRHGLVAGDLHPAELPAKLPIQTGPPPPPCTRAEPLAGNCAWSPQWEGTRSAHGRTPDPVKSYPFLHFCLIISGPPPHISSVIPVRWHSTGSPGKCPITLGELAAVTGLSLSRWRNRRPRAALLVQLGVRVGRGRQGAAAPLSLLTRAFFVPTGQGLASAWPVASRISTVVPDLWIVAKWSSPAGDRS